jgi:hypothetical protein
MPLTDHIRALITPDRSRWKPMLLGLALFAAAVGAAAALQPSKLMEALLLVVGLAAWLLGACAMVGYVRWFFASELSRARRDKSNAVETEKGESRSEER